MNKKIKVDIKKIEKILLILLVIIFILGIVIIYISKNDKTVLSKEKLDYIYSEEWNDEIFPEGMPKFFREYDGNLTAQNIGKSISHVTNEIIPQYNKLLKDKNEEQIKEYFNLNQDVIALDLGINEENEFIQFINEISKIDLSNFELEKYYIDEETIYSNSTYATGDLYITYKECEEISLKIKVDRDKHANISSIKYYK